MIHNNPKGLNIHNNNHKMIFINLLISVLFCYFTTAPLISCFHRDDSLLTEFDVDSMDKGPEKDQDISCGYITKEPSESLFCCTTGDSDLQSDSVEKLALLREKRACASDLTMPISLKNENITQNVASGTAIWDLTNNTTQKANITDSGMNKTDSGHSFSNLTANSTTNSTLNSTLATNATSANATNATTSTSQKPKDHKSHLNTTDSAANATTLSTNLGNSSSSSNSTNQNSNSTAAKNSTSKLNATSDGNTSTNATNDDFSCDNETVSFHNMTSNTTMNDTSDIYDESCVDGFTASQDHSETPAQNTHDTKNATKNHDDILSGDSSTNNPILYYLFSLSLLIVCIVS